MTWRAFLVETMTGVVGAQLDIAGTGSWSIPLNGIEEWNVTVGKDQLRRIDSWRWGPWAGSILMAWETSDGTLAPWLLGPIVQPPKEQHDTATLTCRGLGALLEKRVVLAAEYADMTTLARSSVALVGMSLGTIAQEVVKRACAKSGGLLPIVFRSPRETGSRLNQRTYEGWNLANNGAFKRITEITKVRNGPDIVFRPEWVDEGRSVAWGMWHGTVAQPTIGQDWTMDIDTTAPTAPVAAATVTRDAAPLNSRVYWTGAGEGAGTLVRMVEDVKRRYFGMPLLEQVGATSDSDNPALIQAHAAAALASGVAPITQISVTVDGSDPRCEIGRWHVGDAARLTLGTEWLTVPAGTTEQRIIAAKGSWTSSAVDLDFQQDREVYTGEDDQADGASS